METVQQDQSTGGDAGGSRSFKSKGPTLGKGKACEACRGRRIRCNGAHPKCSNCIQFDKVCIYIERARPPSSAVALSARLASLEERYRALSEVELARRSPAGAAVGLLLDPEMAMDRMGFLDFNQLPPPDPTIGEFQSNALDDPYLEKSMSRADRKLMIDLYFRECYRYNVAITQNHFFESLENLDHSRRPHPCLFNAMVLVAYDFAHIFPIEPVLDESGARFREFHVPASLPSSEVLLARTQAHSEQSLAGVDRLQDYIQTSLLLANWHFRQGHLMQGQYSMAAVSRLVINCKLHQIDNEVMQEMAPGREHPLPGQSRWDGTLLDRPKSIEELALRVGLFWQAFYGDKCTTLITGLPPSFDEGDTAHITTIWPRDMDEYLSGVAFNVPYTSYGNLFDGSTPHERPVDKPFTMLFKCAAIQERMIRITSSNTVTAHEIQALRKTMDILRKNHSSLYDETLLTGIAPHSRSRSFCEISFKAAIEIYLLIAEIQFTYIGTMGVIEDEEARFESRVDSARQCAKRIAETMDEMVLLAAGTTYEATKRPGIEHMCYVTGLLMSSPSRVMVHQIHKLQGQMKNLEDQNVPDKSQRIAALRKEIKSAETDLVTMMEAIDRVRQTYPIVDVLWERVMSEKRAEAVGEETEEQ